MFELLEQSLVHEELDKVRRDLDDFSYRTKDASHLLNLPYLQHESKKEDVKEEPEPVLQTIKEKEEE